jgi:hypothetical protein
MKLAAQRERPFLFCLFETSIGIGGTLRMYLASFGCPGGVELRFVL